MAEPVRRTPGELLRERGQLADDIVAVRIGSRLCDLHTPIDPATDFTPIHATDPDALDVIRHSAAHVMADAVQRLFPGTRVTIGPAIETGFYYDFDRPDGHFVDADLAAIEKEMRKIIKEKKPFFRQEVSRDEARELFAKMGESYKVEILQNIPEGEAISLFAQMGSIADVYDAMTSDRPYQRAEAPTVALRKLFEWGNFHFNPVLVQAFIRTLGIYPVGSLVRLQNQRLAVVLEQNPESLLRPRVKVIYDTVRRSYLTPYLVDLARNPPAGHEEIAGPETFERWQIDPRRWRLD